jgi:hypothetical protein
MEFPATHMRETGLPSIGVQMRDIQQLSGINVEAASKPARIMPAEFLADLQSAASMIMSREECAAIAKEIEQIRNPHRAAA